MMVEGVRIKCDKIKIKFEISSKGFFLSIQSIFEETKPPRTHAVTNLKNCKRKNLNVLKFDPRFMAGQSLPLYLYRQATLLQKSILRLKNKVQILISMFPKWNGGVFRR